jgi:hypothetical protein
MQHDTSPHRVLFATAGTPGKIVTVQCAGLVLAYSRRLFMQYYPRFTRFEAKAFLLRGRSLYGRRLPGLCHRQHQRPACRRRRCRRRHCPRDAGLRPRSWLPIPRPPGRPPRPKGQNRAPLCLRRKQFPGRSQLPLGALFRRLFLTRLIELHAAGRLAFFGTLAGLADRRSFLRHLAPVRKKRFVVYAKPPFTGPEAVLAYLSRYTHRVAISNHRLIAFDEVGVTFRYKDYRRDGPERQRVMTLAPHEFIRRFLLHVLPRGFHRIRHYGLLA